MYSPAYSFKPPDCVTTHVLECLEWGFLGIFLKHKNSIYHLLRVYCTPGIMLITVLSYLILPAALQGKQSCHLHPQESGIAQVHATNT
jgi:hypothetical protein